jgi:hypothetical protein
MKETVGELNLVIRGELPFLVSNLRNINIKRAFPAASLLLHEIQEAMA